MYRYLQQESMQRIVALVALFVRLLQGREMIGGFPNTRDVSYTHCVNLLLGSIQ